ncbi:hypothetical protein Salat_1462600 [Sesamum alatum]|uniref:Integrase catalytic domain-containing protein n=1 Tax=Sesamum alatum TaxID=300844 RepID=A0AAE1YB54_9LAMI|nr:hypothetical protein Salat_1462600 [Sesamum alatum]
MPLSLDELQTFYASHLVGNLLFQKARTSTLSSPSFIIRSGLLYKNGRLFIPTESLLSRRLILEFHTSPLGGHSGLKPTMARFAASFSWPRMYKEVKQFIQQCTVCRQNMYLSQAPYGLLQPLLIPQEVWEDISMDFMTHLPNSSRKTIIWVVIDRLTKFAHFIALSSGFAAASLASIFLWEIYRLHGTPRTIVSNRDRVFC